MNNEFIVRDSEESDMMGKALRKVRKMKKMSSKSFAEEIGMSYVTFRNWERGIGRVPKSLRYEIDEILNLGFYVHTRKIDEMLRVSVNPNAKERANYFDIHIERGREYA